MAPVRVGLTALALVAAGPVHADPVERWQSYIEQASARFGIPAEWIEQVMRAESGGRTMQGDRPIVSRAGAIGLMQLMPSTWAEMRARLGLGPDPHNPHDNILAGTAYLRLMYDRFGYPGLFAAYNAGPARYAAYLADAGPLPAETRAYLVELTESSILRKDGTIASASVRRPPANGIFFALKQNPHRSQTGEAGRDGLFVALGIGASE